MNLTDVKSKEIMPGFHGKIIHGETVTWVYWNIEKGSSLNEHHHVHEQIMYVLEGEFEFILNGKKNICMPGSYFVIPSNIPHSGKAITACKIMDIFCPVREDL